jgi:hypothetical protein
MMSAEVLVMEFGGWLGGEGDVGGVERRTLSRDGG